MTFCEKYSYLCVGDDMTRMMIVYDCILCTLELINQSISHTVLKNTEYFEEEEEEKEEQKGCSIIK